MTIYHSLFFFFFFFCSTSIKIINSSDATAPAFTVWFKSPTKKKKKKMVPITAIRDTNNSRITRLYGSGLVAVFGKFTQLTSFPINEK